MSKFDHITQSQREMLAEDLHELTDAEWATVTVCDPLTVRQLVAHLTSMGTAAPVDRSG